MRAICVGIVGAEPGWEILLGREGIPHRRIETPDELAECSAAVAGDDALPEWTESLRTHLRRGGGLLCSSSLYARISGKSAKSHLLRSLKPEPGSLFAGTGFLDLFTRVWIPENANVLPYETGAFSAYAGEVEGGYVIALPADPAVLTGDGRQTVKSFYSRRRRLPYERVPTVSKEGLQMLVARALELIHHAQGLPHVHLWYYPEGNRSVLLFRVDTDHGDEGAVSDLAGLSRRAGIPFTWFLDMQSQDRLLPLYRSMEGQEIGLHCYAHRRYAERSSALADLRKGRALLENAGFLVEGCALPYGQWSEALGTVLADLGFLYSSEFSCDADNLPGYPLIERRPSGVLQVPVHPISIGSLRRQGFGEEEMIEYFDGVLAWKLNRRLPVALYHHPNNGHLGVLEQVRGSARSKVMYAVTMSTFARWWTKRTASGCEIHTEGESISASTKREVEDLHLHITRAGGVEAFTRLQPRMDLRSLRWESAPVPLALPADIRRIRRFNPWIPLQRCEDVLHRFIG